MLLYIGVFKAVYDYTAQADEELSLTVGDLLYLLEKSDIDDWWKVKKRVLPSAEQEVDEPVGLIPANYIEAVRVISIGQFFFHTNDLGGSGQNCNGIIRLCQTNGRRIVLQ